MIAHLFPGLRVLLPSGNIIVLVRRVGAAWVCEYPPMARARGETEFSAVWLRRVGVRA